MSEQASKTLAPRANDLLIGHEAAERTLFEAARAGRLAHAWLIAGPRGIGKATLAFRFARHLFVHHGAKAAQAPSLFGPEPKAASKVQAADGASLVVGADHPVFKRVAAAGHADLRSVERTLHPKTGKLRGEIVVDDVRALGEFLRLTPAEGGWRVAIVDCADEMNPHAANAVLKVLEEPPARAVLLLVSHSPGRLLPTIRSRCRKLVLKPLAAAEFARAMVAHFPNTEPAERATLGALSEGSLGRAHRLADMGGVAIYREMMDLFASLPRLDVAAAHKLAGKLAGEGFEVGTELFGAWHARLVRAAATGEGGRELLEGEGAVFRRLANPHALDRWFELWDKNRRLFRQADGLNLDRRQVLLSAFLSLEQAARA